jgi:hypothetical protein
MADAGAHDATERRTVGLLVAAGLVAVATVVLVATIGIARPPELAAVDAATRPDRSVALFGWRADGSCLDLVAPDGTLRTVRCGLGEYGAPLVWDGRGIGLLRYGPAGEELVFLDPADGVVAGRLALDEATLRGGLRPMGLAATERDGGSLIVRDADGRIVWQVAAPETYRISGSAQDVSTGRLVLLDSARRLLVLEPGASEPRVWVTDVGFDYAELLWEGSDLLGE